MRTLVADPPPAEFQALLGLAQAEYRPIERSGLVDLGAAELRERIDWPPIDD